MDSKFIVMLKDKGRRIVTRNKNGDGTVTAVVNPIAEIEITKVIAMLYVKVGLQRSMTAERFTEETKAAAHLLVADIQNDRIYWDVRIEEIDYCINNGLKGRLDKDKPDIVITYKTIIRWLENYVKHDAYKDAVAEIRNRPVPVERQIVSHQFNDDDYKSMINEAYREYKEYRQKSPVLSSGDRKIESVIGLPILCKDFGGVRMNWLIENGYAIKGENLVDVFDRAFKNGGRFEKIVVES